MKLAKPEVRSRSLRNISAYHHHISTQYCPLMLGRWTPRLASHSSRASCRHQAQCRLTSTHITVSRGDDLGPTRDDAHQTYRVRRDGSGKVLPLPPLLDPIVVETRSRWENTKLQPKVEDFTPFQKKLQANTYGRHWTVHKVTQC